MKMKNIFLLFCAFIGLSCDNSDFEPNLFEGEISMEAMDKVTIGGNLQVVINSQSEYDTLIYYRFTKPLKDYWDRNIDEVINILKTRYPNLTEQAYADSAKKLMYELPPLMGTENAAHPKIDFNIYTLLGMAAHSGGCPKPDYQNIFIRNEQEKVFIMKVIITSHGTCGLGFDKNMWVIVRKIPSNYSIKFEREDKHE